jgi:hypothetical protein
VHDAFSKALALLVSAAIVGTFGWLGLVELRDYTTFGDAPRSTSLAGAVAASAEGRQWVRVEGAPWQCASLKRDVPGGAAFLPASSDDGATIVARFDHPIRCADVAKAPLIGIVEPMASKRAADLRSAGLSLPTDAPLRTLEVCSSCGKDNARLGVLICSLLVLVGLAIYPLRHLVPRFRVRSLQDAIRAPEAEAPAANRTIRLRGLAILGAGVVAIAFGKGWVIYGVLPVPWFGAFALALGVFMAALPDRYRRMASGASRSAKPR